MGTALHFAAPGAKAMPEDGDRDMSIHGVSSGSGEHRIRSSDGAAHTLSEKTVISLKIGGVIAILVVGRYWGVWETTAGNTKSTLDRHEQSISDLRDTLTEMSSDLQQIQSDQAASKNQIGTAVQNSTAIIYELGNIKVALATKGIIVKE